MILKERIEYSTDNDCTCMEKANLIEGNVKSMKGDK